MSEPFGSPKASEMVVIALRLAIGQPSAGQLLAQDIRHDGWLAMSEPFGSPKASEMVVIALRLAIGQPSAGQLLAQDIRP